MPGVLWAEAPTSGSPPFDLVLQLFGLEQCARRNLLRANRRRLVELSAQTQKAELEAHERHRIVGLVSDHSLLFDKFGKTLKLLFPGEPGFRIQNPGSRKDSCAGQLRIQRWA